MEKQKPTHNYAYIDDANLYHGIAKLGWKMDYARFRVWLSEKYCVKVAYLFTGFLPSYQKRYADLTKYGFTLIHKQIIRSRHGKIKGNCDAELVLQAVHDMHKDRFNQAIIVSSDGDFSCIAKFLNNRKKLHIIISPSHKCSFLLRMLNVPLLYLDTQRQLLEVMPIKEKALDGDGTP
jgi:uncharacterized LabA/DUF88 family protein